MPTKIGIITKRWDNDVMGAQANYLNWAEQFGTPILLTTLGVVDFMDIYSKVEAFILIGGEDVDTTRYNAFPGMYTGRANPYLEYFDRFILPELILNKLPIFGICRGHQSLNVHFGGTLFQHIWGHTYSQKDDDLVHKIIYEKDGKDFTVETNSFHHQAVDRLGIGLEVVANSVKDKNNRHIIVEALKHKELPIASVQFHPEKCSNLFAEELFRSILV